MLRLIRLLCILPRWLRFRSGPRRACNCLFSLVRLADEAGHDRAAISRLEEAALTLIREERARRAARLP